MLSGQAFGDFCTSSSVREMAVADQPTWGMAAIAPTCRATDRSSINGKGLKGEIGMAVKRFYFFLNKDFIFCLIKLQNEQLSFLFQGSMVIVSIVNSLWLTSTPPICLCCPGCSKLVSGRMPLLFASIPVVWWCIVTPWRTPQNCGRSDSFSSCREGSCASASMARCMSGRCWHSRRSVLFPSNQPIAIAMLPDFNENCCIGFTVKE